MMVSAPSADHFQGQRGGRPCRPPGLPAGPVRAFALFAHCFTCTKDVLAAKRIASELANVRKLGRALLIMHAPLDATVGIDNASKIFAAAKLRIA